MRKALVLLIATFGLSACGEQAQVVVYEQGRYQGKHDAQPWSNDGKWAKGDRESWERAIKARQLTQNEYGRMY